MTDELPQQIVNWLDDEQLANLRTRTGWATGTVVEREADGSDVTQFEFAAIELLNGDGSSREKGGVRFVTPEDATVRTGRALATEPAEDNPYHPPYYYVAEYNEDDVNFGKPAP